MEFLNRIHDLLNRSWKSGTMRFRLVMAFVGFGAIPLVLVGCIMAFLIFQTQAKLALRLEQEAVGRIATEVHSFVDAFKRDLRFTARAQALRGLNRSQLEAMFGILLSHQKAFQEIVLINARGMEVLRISRTEMVTDSDLGDRSMTESFRFAWETGQEYVGPVTYDQETGEPSIEFAVPLSPAKRSLGVVLARVNLRRIWDVIQNAKTRPGEAIYIVDEQGKLIAHPNPSVVLQGTWFVPPGKDGVFRGLDNKPSVMAQEVLDLGGRNLTIVAERSLLSAQRLSFDVIGAVLIFLVLVFVVASVLGSLVVNRIVKPINALSQVTARISAGDLSQRVHVESFDEIGELGRAFNTMTRKLGKTLNELTQEISERKQMQVRLATEKERLAVTLRSIGEAVIATDDQQRVVLLNMVAEKLTGWEQAEAHGKELSEIMNVVNDRTKTPVADHLVPALEHGQMITIEGSRLLISRDGEERVIDESIAPIRNEEGKVIGAVLVFRDVSAEIKIEEELRKTQKLESIGVLAGGIAHDFNNLLTGILGNISLAKFSVEKDTETYAVLAEAEKAAGQAQNLTYQLLTFSKGGAPIKQLSSIAEIIRDSAGFSLRGSTVKCVFNLPSDLWSVEIDKGQISQVIQNLVINARQAMPEEGVLEIAAENITITEESGSPLTPGTYVKVQVTDHGEGIPPENLDKIFDPFFTTKSHGNGLGLATAYSIIKKHEGRINAVSLLGQGTTFFIYLPALPEVVKTTTPTESTFTYGSGRVLVMDDEEMVREATAKVLEVLGYEPDSALHGDDAVRKIQQAQATGKQYDLVILDLTVPGGLGGKETLPRIRAIAPTIKAIVTSGYSNDPVMAQYKEFGFDGMVVKPYKVRDFSVTVHEVLKG